MRRFINNYTAAAVVLLLLAGFWFFAGSDQQQVRQAPFLLLTGALFGLVLQRSRFCFFCVLRDLFEYGNGKPAAGLIVALAVGSAGYLVLFGNWIADPSAGYLPQDAHIGPVSWHLLLGGLLFGWGMALSGSCISAHLYRLGEGYMVAPFALAGSAAGFVIGFMVWNRLYVATVSTSPVVWLPETGGYAVWALIQITLLLALMIWLLVRFQGTSSAADESGCDPQGAALPGNTEMSRNTSVTAGVPGETSHLRVADDCMGPPATPSASAGSVAEKMTLSSIWNRVFVHRWPTWVGGIAVGVLSMIAYLRVEPLGVTAELGRYSRQLGSTLGILPDRLEGLDGFAGCSTAAAPELLTGNGIFVLALVGGSLFSALLSGRFQLSRLTAMKAGKGLAGGMLLGFGAMISLGCTIGTTLSGISAFALSGWVFSAAMVAGVWTGIRWKWHH